MWVIGTLLRLLVQTVELALLLLWRLLVALARLLGLAGWREVTTGEEYEEFVAGYLERQGFRVLGHTGRSGDLGVDLVARKGLKTYAVQCKFYSGLVDGAAVQQVVAGMACYGCNAALVVTNSSLTPGAWTLARRNEVEVMEQVSPIDAPGSLHLESLLSPARLAAFALGLLGALELFLHTGAEAVRQEPLRYGLLTVGCFLAAAVGVALLRWLWRGLTKRL